MNAKTPSLIHRLCDRLRPAVWRQAKPVPDAKLVADLATIDDSNPHLGVWTDNLHGQFVAQIEVALNFNSTDQQKLRALERAAALKDTLDLFEFNRQQAKAHEQVLAEQRKNAGSGEAKQ